MRQNKGLPLLHIDIHGRTDKYIDNSDIEFGVMPMKVYFNAPAEKEYLIDPIIQKFEEKMNLVFKNQKLNGHKVICNSDCVLHGYWGGGEP
jgi:starvation-inducible outer membrane lipoprotein